MVVFKSSRYLLSSRLRQERHYLMSWRFGCGTFESSEEMWSWWGYWNIFREIFRWTLQEYDSNQGKEKWHRNYSLISVQFKSEDKLIESGLFTLQLKAWVEQWDLNLLSSDIFIDDIKNLLKTWMAHKNKLGKRGKECICGTGEVYFEDGNGLESWGWEFPEERQWSV